MDGANKRQFRGYLLCFDRAKLTGRHLLFPSNSESPANPSFVCVVPITGVASDMLHEASIWSKDCISLIHTMVDC